MGGKASNDVRTAAGKRLAMGRCMNQLEPVSVIDRTRIRLDLSAHFPFGTATVRRSEIMNFKMQHQCHCY